MNVDRKELLTGLNEDLAYEYQAVVMYNTYAASIVGPYRKELEDFFRAEIPDEVRHAEFLGNKITALGGQPTTRIPEVQLPDSARGMLEAVMKAETDTVERYTHRRKQAEGIGDFALVNDLEDMISEEARHKEQTAKLLQGSWD